jgi:hypothetical protein
MSLAKPADKLTQSDWKKYPIWTFDLGNEGKPGRDETWMVPVKELPVTDLGNCGCQANASLACGRLVTAVLRGISLKDDPKEGVLWENFARLRSAANRQKPAKELRYSIWVKENWWIWHKESFLSLGDFKSHTPADLAKTLDLSVEEIFPITYDISVYAIGPDTITKG